MSGILEEQTFREKLSHFLDPEHPLLREFRKVCPGTYKHSQALSTMVEGVSTVLRLDVERMKVAALYHDIGKSFFPWYFTENQGSNEDPHLKLPTEVSFSIITRHVSDSVAILVNNQRFPRDVIEVISQHHGKTIAKYFFKKSGSTDKDAYRYKTKKPNCIEAAVLMICDHVEATSRSLVQANKFEAAAVVTNIMDELIEDGQLDNVVMRVGDLKIIKDILIKDLESTYQKRVDYDKADEERGGDSIA